MPTPQELLESISSGEVSGLYPRHRVVRDGQGHPDRSRGVTVALATSPRTPRRWTRSRREIARPRRRRDRPPVEIVVESRRPPLPAAPRVRSPASRGSAVDRGRERQGRGRQVDGRRQPGAARCAARGPHRPARRRRLRSERPDDARHRRAAAQSREDAHRAGRALRRQGHLASGCFLGERHAGDLARADGDQAASPSSSATSTGASSTTWSSTCRPAPATPSSPWLSRCRSTGGVIVTTPQDVALLDVRRGITMFEQVQRARARRGREHELPRLHRLRRARRDLRPRRRRDAWPTSSGCRSSARFRSVRVIREGMDRGAPIVVDAPSSPEAECFLAVARAVLEQLAARGATRLPTVH